MVPNFSILDLFNVSKWAYTLEGNTMVGLRELRLELTSGRIGNCVSLMGARACLNAVMLVQW